MQTRVGKSPAQKGEKLLFFKKFLRHGIKIASISPSSKALARASLTGIDWSSAKVVVELGAGTGALTEAIVTAARQDTTIIAIEQDHDFAEILRSKFSSVSNLDVVEGDCLKLEDILAARGIRNVDAIVSGLPVTALSEDERRALIKVIDRILVPGGLFNQISELPLLYLPFYRRYFKDVRFLFVPKNVPPGGVYMCRHPRA